MKQSANTIEYCQVSSSAAKATGDSRVRIPSLAPFSFNGNLRISTTNVASRSFPASFGLPPVSRYWFLAKDGDAHCREIFHRHYSFRAYKDGRDPKLFVGPGEKMVLVTERGDALFVWKVFISGDGQQGVNCAVFRNESDVLSSALILDAEMAAWKRWPGRRLYTYVNAKRIKSTNPGYCYKLAGWRVCGRSKWKGLVILEKEATL